MSKNVIMLDGGRMRCTACGTNHGLFKDGEPLPMWEFLAVMKGFGEEHAKCRPPKRPKGTPRCDFCGDPHEIFEHVNETTKSPEDWLNCGDTGISSRAIWRHMTGRPIPGRDTFGDGYPLDPSDFGRCYRLRAVGWRLARSDRRDGEVRGRVGAARCGVGRAREALPGGARGEHWEGAAALRADAGAHEGVGR